MYLSVNKLSLVFVAKRIGHDLVIFNGKQYYTGVKLHKKHKKRNYKKIFSFIHKFIIMRTFHDKLKSHRPGVLWDIGKQYTPRCNAAERSVTTGAILLPLGIPIEKLDKKIENHS